MTAGLVWLGAAQDFPDPSTALSNPNGLLAAGGELGVARLLIAYREGIFPWFSGGQPPLWWSPDPRAVLFPGDQHCSSSMAKLLRRENYQITCDQQFATVLARCAGNRQDGTWIVPEVSRAYLELHQRGYAHSLEVSVEGELIGGLYGVQVGSVFCGESMFHRRANASKVAFLAMAALLFRQGFTLIDCQLENPHLHSLGVRTMPRQAFIEHLRTERDRALPWPVCNQMSRDLMA